jgi:hypothetical protein
VSALFAGLLFYFSPERSLDIAFAVFAASATFGALVLPAAELAGGVVKEKVNFWMGVTYGSAPSPWQAVKTSLDQIEKYAEWVRTGSVFVLLAVVMASLSLFVPKIPLASGRVLRLDYVFAGSGCGTLLVGAILFVPFALSVYQLDALGSAKDHIERTLARKPPQRAQTEKRIPIAEAPMGALDQLTIALGKLDVSLQLLNEASYRHDQVTLEQARLVLCSKALTEIRAKVAETENHRTSLSQRIDQIEERIKKEEDPPTRDQLAHESAQANQDLVVFNSKLQQERNEESALSSELHEVSVQLKKLVDSLGKSKGSAAVADTKPGSPPPQ